MDSELEQFESEWPPSKKIHYDSVSGRYFPENISQIDHYIEAESQNARLQVWRAGANECRAPEAIIKTAVDRFLGWKLPEHFNPDAGIYFNPTGPYAPQYGSFWPIGTNLFDADQATEMFRYCLQAAPQSEQESK